MKSRSSLKQLSLAILTGLTLAAGGVQAGGQSCPLEHQAARALPHGPAAQGDPMQTFQERARQIELSLRAGRISPYDAGRLLRQHWELARFQQGFLSAGQPVPAEGRGMSCLGADLAGKLAPLGDMALGGLRSAGGLMRALLRESERLMQEPTPSDPAPL
ncbi:MAG: hypothetical protein FJ209_03180 [Betaproteobacteria bacterium]|nr:hypothetical protein [Betaproteobacteria bacterium]